MLGSKFSYSPLLLLSLISFIIAAYKRIPKIGNLHSCYWYVLTDPIRLLLLYSPLLLLKIIELILLPTSVQQHPFLIKYDHLNIDLASYFTTAASPLATFGDQIWFLLFFCTCFLSQRLRLQWIFYHQMHQKHTTWNRIGLYSCQQCLGSSSMYLCNFNDAKTGEWL